MNADTIALILTFTGLALVILGVVISLLDYRRALKTKDVQPEPTSGGFLEGLAAFAKALREHRLGMQLTLIGVALMLAGGVTAAVSSI